MKKLIILIYLISSTAFAKTQITTIENGVTIYSEFYQKSKSKFKGTIIFENGSGTDLNEWTDNKTFFQCAKNYGSLFLYDRNGLGKSPPDLHLSSNNPITTKFINDKLLKLLELNDIRPPYILIAHSYGGMYAGYFALKYPNLVKAIIMVDPVPKDFHFSTQRMNHYAPIIIKAKEQLAAKIYQNSDGSEAELAYQLLGFELSKHQIKELGTINNDIPVIIVSSTDMQKEKPLQEDWYISQKQWLNKNPKSKIILTNTGHFI